MNDRVAAFHPLDPGRIEILDPLESAWWCRELHCSEQQLHQAVEQVGVHVAAVREWLEARPGPESGRPRPPR